MTEQPDQHEQTETQLPDSQNMFVQKDGVDWLLAYIVGLAEKGVSMSVTVAAEGVLISGNIIGGREYFNGLADNFRAANVTGSPADLDWRETLAKGFASFEVMYPEPQKMPPDQVAKPVYLHLKNARPILRGSNTVGGTLWRVQLAKVTAFTLSGM